MNAYTTGGICFFTCGIPRSGHIGLTAGGTMPLKSKRGPDRTVAGFVAEFERLVAVFDGRAEPRDGWDTWAKRDTDVLVVFAGRGRKQTVIAGWVRGEGVLVAPTT